jgi:hypothetical protein
MEAFKYASPGELYYPRASAFRKPGMTYRRFPTAAEAIRFAIEGIPPPVLHGCYMEVEGERYHAGQMRELYESKAYPLTRMWDRHDAGE